MQGENQPRRERVATLRGQAELSERVLGPADLFSYATETQTHELNSEYSNLSTGNPATTYAVTHSCVRVACAPRDDNIQRGQKMNMLLPTHPATQNRYYTSIKKPQTVNPRPQSPNLSTQTLIAANTTLHAGLHRLAQRVLIFLRRRWLILPCQVCMLYCLQIRRDSTFPSPIHTA